MQTVDLKGKTGATYRFRRVPESTDLPAHAGNFVVLAPTGEVLTCGTRRTLVELHARWSDLIGDHGRMFVRLNVARATRLAEHADLMEALIAPTDLREVG